MSRSSSQMTRSAFNKLYEKNNQNLNKTILFKKIMPETAVSIMF